MADRTANDVYKNGSTVSTTIESTTGGNFEQLTPSTTPAVTTITDSIDNTVASSQQGFALGLGNSAAKAGALLGGEIVD